MSEVDLSSTQINTGTGGDKIADDAVAQADGTTVKVPVSKLALGDVGENRGLVSAGNPLPVHFAELLEEQKKTNDWLEQIFNLLLEQNGAR